MGLKFSSFSHMQWRITYCTSRMYGSEYVWLLYYCIVPFANVDVVGHVLGFVSGSFLSYVVKAEMIHKH